MEVPYIGDNPFAALSILVAPAILTSASSVLCLGTANRLARVVDRTHIVSTKLASLASDGERTATVRRQLEELRDRWSLVLRALICFYMSVGSFAAAALISLVGSSFTSPNLRLVFNCLAILGLLSAIVGVGSLMVGCSIMVRETRLAIRNLTEEVELAGLPVEVL